MNTEFAIIMLALGSFALVKPDRQSLSWVHRHAAPSIRPDAR
jgi:hypothetical protein